MRVLWALLALAGCAAAPVAPPPASDPVNFQPASAYQRFTGRPAAGPVRANSEVAADFLDLSFALESGQGLGYLSRFEGPISLRVVGPLPQVAQADLAALLARLRAEAGIEITMSTSPNAQITIQALPARVLRGEVSDAACFLAPNISDWQQFSQTRGTSVLAWSGVNQRQRAAIFVPSDVAPQEIRDCLHEELAQTLGPLNDLYRLEDSTFNDDDIHRVLTRFDMLILRATYDPALRSGMSREEVAGRLPSLLARLNPAGQKTGRSRGASPAAWHKAMAVALAGGMPTDRRRQAAERALGLSQGWGDLREGMAAYTYGRLNFGKNPAAAEAALRRADNIFSQSPRMALHRAHVAMQLAPFALQRGDSAAVLALVDPAMVTAKRYQNAALLAMLGFLRTEALALAGQSAEGQRVDSLAWSRYGFGSTAAGQARLNSVAQMSPRNQGASQ